MLDKDGLTEEEFLSAYDASIYPHPSVGTDMVLFSVRQDKPVILLIQRGNHPFIGSWAFPGGYVNPGESTEDAVMRELSEETNLSRDIVTPEQMVTVSTPGRDPRGWNITVAYMAVLPEPVAVTGGDDAAKAEWFDVEYLRAGNEYKLTLKAQNTEIYARLIVARNSLGVIDINKTEIIECEGIAFDHAKIILYAIEKL